MFNFNRLRSLHFLFKKKRDGAYWDSEEKYKEIVEHSSVGIYIIQDDSFKYVNKKLCKIFGYSYEEIVDKISPAFLAFESDKNIVKDNVRKQISEESTSTEYEFRAVKKDGNLIWIRILGDLITYKGKPAISGTLIDITDRKKVEDALYAKKERLRATLEVTKIGIWDWDVENDIWTASPVYYTMLGYKPETKPSDRAVWLSKIHPDDREYVRAKITDVLSYKADNYIYEARILHADGKYRWHQVLGHIIEKDNKGRIKRMVGIRKDITDFKQAEEELKISKTRLQVLIDTIPDLVWVKDPQGVYLQCNKRFEQLYGVTEKEILGKTDYDFIDKESADFFRKKDNEAAKAGKSCINEENVTFADGHNELLETIKTPIYDNDETLVGVLGIGRDITQRKKTELELLKAKEQAEESEAKLFAAFESMSEAIFISDTKGNLVNANNSYIHLTGFKTRDEFIKKLEDYPLLFDVYLPTGELAPIEKWAVPRALRGETAENEIYKIHRKDTNDTWTGSYNFAPIRNNDDEIIGCVVTIRNVTEVISKEKELIKAKEKAEESDRLKSAFLANMSHEIRTPMNGILGFAELLKEPGLSGEQQKQYIQIIEKSGARMLNIIKDIISISKIESGIMDVHFSETNINNQLQFVYDSLKIDAEHKKIKLSLTCTLPDNEAFITTDSEKFYGILSNLVRNAIKYTDKGTIEFGYAIKGEEVEFYVKDTGIGIPKEKIEVIFERFIQADIADKMARQGAGLGLAISKAYVETLGGKIWVDSEESKGSTFFFTLPLNMNKEDDISVGTHFNTNEKTVVSENLGLKVLIAEDDKASEMLISKMLERISRNTLKATRGTSAIEACQNNPDIDLVLMDIQMPDMNGYDATKKIREFNKKVIIIAQTAFALEGDREKAIKVGCNDYISKPIKQDDLEQIIQKHFKSYKKINNN